MNVFEDKNIAHMLIGADSAPFDSDDYLFEVKFDGERCVAYLDPQTGTELRNKRNVRMLPKVPELSEMHKQVRQRCILDGELLIIENGRPNFYQIQKRSLMSNTFKIQLHAKQYPATFTAFDILYYKDQQVTHLPLMERKRLLQKVFRNQNDRFAVSQHIDTHESALFELAAAQALEGVVAKQKDSRYYFGRRTKDWIKIKNLLDADFVVIGYMPKDNGMTSIVLAQYDTAGTLIYKGHVTLGVGGENFKRITALPKTKQPPMEAPAGNESATWVVPELVCTVKFMEYTANGGMRQPVFKGLRYDKQPRACLAKR